MRVFPSVPTTAETLPTRVATRGSPYVTGATLTWLNASPPIRVPSNFATVTSTSFASAIG